MAFQKLGNTQNTINAIAGEALAQYDVCYFHSNGKLKKVQCDGTEAEADAIAIALVALSEDETGLFALGRSKILNPAWNHTKGATVYVSATPGALTETKPNTNGQYVKPLGVFIETNTLLFAPELGYEVGDTSNVDGD